VNLDREKEIREWHKDLYTEYMWHANYIHINRHVKELFAEIDSLREKLAVAVEALEDISVHIDYENDFPTAEADKAKKALSKIRGEKPILQNEYISLTDAEFLRKCNRRGEK
jgi:hypothetical protein